jgi:predicted metal-dependent phosphoesterase TrpH
MKIDLHIHTKYSDGSYSVAEVLKRAVDAGLDTISITDHNRVGAYDEIEKPEIRNLFPGKIIQGIEITTHVDGKLIEILGYNIDTKKMKKYMTDYPGKNALDSYRDQTIKNLKKLGLNVPQGMNNTKSAWEVNGLILSDKKICDKTDPKFFGNITYLYRAGITNKKSPLFVDPSAYLKSAKEVATIIKDCGGVAFLAHPAEYLDDADTILDFTKDFVDGIECFHPSADKACREKLVKFAKANDLLISGGSDFHGTIKPGVEIAIGRGDLVVPQELVNWV